jgi:hypothetical protein
MLTRHDARQQLMSATSRLTRFAGVAAALLLAAALAGCSSTIDAIPHMAGGLPEATPARPAAQPAYPAVHDMPQSRQEGALSDLESKRLREDLKSTRNRVSAPLPDPNATGTTAPAAGSARNP